MSLMRPSGQGLTVRGPETDWDVKTGWRSTWIYEGPQTEILAQRNIELSSGATQLRVSPNGNGLWELYAAYPASETGEPVLDDAQDVHEIEVQVEQISFWNSLKLRTYLSNADIAIVKSFAEKFLGGGSLEEIAHPTRAEYITAMKEQITIASRTNAEVVFDRFTSGTDGCIEYREVYRRTITAASPQQIQATYNGVGLIWTTSEVEAWEGTPAGTAWFGLQSGMQWLKAPPTVQAVSGGKTQIQYYYTEAVKATALLYTAHGSATLLDSGATAI